MAEFQGFLTTYEPAIRPDGLIQRVRYALQVDADFCNSFRAILPQVRRETVYWPDKIVLHLMQFRKLNATFGEAEVEILRELFKDHRTAILAARFDEDFFTTLERLALFFIFHDLRAIWVVGAFKRTIAESIDEMATSREYGQNRAVFTMMNFLVLELNQIQRVYIRFSELSEAVDADPAANVTLSA